MSPESSLGATMKEPFFWPSAIATIVILALAVRLLMVDTGWITFIILVPLLLIWFLERGLSFARPNIRAHTDGPPAEITPGARHTASASAGSRTGSPSRSSRDISRRSRRAQS